MRKFIVVGILIVAILAVSAASILAQDATQTPVPTTPPSTTAAPTGWLGIAVVEKDNQVVIARVQAGSPANAADLLIGDVIVSYNGTAIDTAKTLVDQLKDSAPGDKATLELLRNGQSTSAEVTLGPSPESIMGRGGRPGPGFGGQIQMDIPALAARLLGAELNETDAGYEITSISANRNPFGLQVGDVVTALNGQNIKELDLRALAENLTSMDQPKLTLSVTRDGKATDLIIDVNPRDFGRGFGQGRPFGGFGQGFPFGNRGQGMPPFGNRGPRGNGNNDNGDSGQDTSIITSGQA